MARAARSNYESSSDEFDTKRLATMIGGGVAVVAVVVFLAFKMFGSKSEAPKPAAPVVAHAPEYPPEVTDLIAQIEAAFKADDFKTARSDVDKLRQLSPSHPRLDFFDGLLTAKSTAANGRGAGKKNGKSGSSAGTSRPSHGGSEPSSTAASSSHAASVPADATTASTPTTPSSASSASTADPSPTLQPETPPGMTQPNSAVPAPPAPAPATGPAAGAPVVAAALPEPTPAAQPTAAEQPARTPAQASPASHRAGGEPPPVVQEAKLVRRVNPDYPSAAKKDGISGFVDLEVTVSKQGNVDDVSVTQSTPPNMFDKSAVAAVRKWKYDPRFVDGLPSTAHLKVHLEFGPNK
jgi:protein TonB